MIAELKKKQMVKEPLIYEGKDGAIEDIISGERPGVPPAATPGAQAVPAQGPWGRTSGGAMAHHTVTFWAGPPALLSQWHRRDSLGDMGVSARSRGPSSTVQSPDPPAAPSCRTQRGCRPLCPVSQLFLLFCSFFLPSFLLLAVSGLLCSALKTVPFTARTGKRSSRLFCDVSFSEESPL